MARPRRYACQPFHNSVFPRRCWFESAAGECLSLQTEALPAADVTRYGLVMFAATMRSPTMGRSTTTGCCGVGGSMGRTTVSCC